MHTHIYTRIQKYTHMLQLYFFIITCNIMWQQELSDVAEQYFLV